MSEEKKYSLWEIRNGFAEKTTGAKPRKPIRKVSLKKQAEDKAAKSNLNGDDTDKEKSSMDAFWKNAEKVISKNPYCWECNEYISPPDYRNSTAHIFPKSDNSGFPSVASNQFNFVVAGVRCGCHNKTHRLDTFSQMSIFKTAVNRFIKFHNQITEKRKYLDLFIEYANELI
jgi:hypothetical protein